jgi:hypothetical protein
MGHFTARIFPQQATCWDYDGIVGQPRNHGPVANTANFEESLAIFGGRMATHFIYVLDDFTDDGPTLSEQH